MTLIVPNIEVINNIKESFRVLEDDEIVIEQIPASNSTNSLPELPEEPPSSLQELICLVKERLLDILQCGMIKNCKYKWSIIIGLVIFFIIVVIGNFENTNKKWIVILIFLFL